MKEIVSVENMRKSDAATIAGGVPGRELMYRAGKAIYESVDWKGPAAMVCGSGNNAGDAYVIAGLLLDAGIETGIILLKEKFSADGLFYFEKCRERGADIRVWHKGMDLSGYATIADGLFGTGYKGSVDGEAAELIDAINKSGAYVVSLDINSGLNGDSGMADLCVHSDITVSVGSFKPGHFLNMAKDVMKEKLNVDIGIKPVDRAYRLIEAEDICHLFAPRKNFSNKGTYGYTALIGGSERYGGAIRLAEMAGAAMRSGAGVVKLALPKSLADSVGPLILESTLFPLKDKDGAIAFSKEEAKELTANVRTAAFGMGAGCGEGAAEMLKFLLKEYEGRLIIDADGLNLLSRMDREILQNRKCEVVLTPHIKEFSRLCGHSVEEIRDNGIVLAEEYAAANSLILLLKGPSTIVTDGENTLLVDAGCSGMATAGSGDVLSGILSAVCGYSEDLLTAVAAGAFINGKAGEAAQERAGSIAMTAGDTVNNIAACVHFLEKLAKSMEKTQ